jgi:hypothetical protein
MRPTCHQSASILPTILITIAIAQPLVRGGYTEEPGRLEFRILADESHDGKAIEKSKAADGFEHPPAGYRWVRLGQTVTGTAPKMEPKRLIVRGARWKDDEFAGRPVHVTGKDAAGAERTVELEIAGNTAETLHVPGDPGRSFQAVSSFRIDLMPRVGVSAGDGAVIRDFPVGSGRVTRAVLIRLDRHDLGEKDLASVGPATDEKIRPAVAIAFTRAGGRKLGALTREHLPERNGAFAYRLAIILDGRLLSAPKIFGAIGDDSGAVGVIELGPDARGEDEERTIKILRASGRK